MITFYSQNEDDWHDSHQEIEDLIDEMLALEPGLSGEIKIYEADFAQPKLTDICSADDLIDYIDEQFYENMPDEHQNESLRGMISQEAVNELDAFLKSWADRHDLNPNWLNPVGKIREISVNVDEYKDYE